MNFSSVGANVASMYPSTVSVSGLTGTVTQVTVQLTGMTHTFPDDLMVGLVGPGGQKATLMARVGGSDDLTNYTVVVDDYAAAGFPSTLLTAASYRPTGNAIVLPSPAPAGPYPASLVGYNNVDPNGTWSLYGYDSFDADGGSLQSWTLNITVAPAPTTTTTTTSTTPTSTSTTPTSTTGPATTTTVPVTTTAEPVTTTTAPPAPPAPELALLPSTTWATQPPIVPPTTPVAPTTQVAAPTTAAASKATTTIVTATAPTIAAIDLNVDATTAGGTLTVTGAGFLPGSPVDIDLHSDPIRLGTAVVSESGTFRFVATLPAVIMGSHEVVAIGLARSGSPLTAMAPITITAPAGNGAGLAFTGSAALTLATIALALIALGFTVTRRSRNTR